MRRLSALLLFLLCGSGLAGRCEHSVTERYAPLARPYSRYLALTKIRITDVAAMMEREELRVPVHLGDDLRWETPMFRWWNEWWRGQRTDEHQSSRYSTDGGGNLDSVIALFELDLLDEGWFELRCPRGQVPGEPPGFVDFNTSHLAPGALRVNAGVPYDTAARAFREFRAAPQAFAWFQSPGEVYLVQSEIMSRGGNRSDAAILRRVAEGEDSIAIDPPSTAAMWRHFVGFAVHPRSTHREELRQQIERGRRTPLRFVQERDFYRELDVVTFD